MDRHLLVCNRPHEANVSPVRVSELLALDAGQGSPPAGDGQRPALRGSHVSAWPSLHCSLSGEHPANHGHDASSAQTASCQPQEPSSTVCLQASLQADWSSCAAKRVLHVHLVRQLAGKACGLCNRAVLNRTAGTAQRYLLVPQDGSLKRLDLCGANGPAATWSVRPVHETVIGLICSHDGQHAVIAYRQAWPASLLMSACRSNATPAAVLRLWSKTTALGTCSLHCACCACMGVSLQLSLAVSCSGLGCWCCCMLELATRRQS